MPDKSWSECFRGNGNGQIRDTVATVAAFVGVLAQNARMSGDGAPRVFVSYAHDSPEHKARVLRFATFLHSRIGLDVHLDQWDDGRRRDWSLWAVENLNNADFVVVVASPDYRRRADGEAPPHEGRGSQFEAAALRNALTRNLRSEVERILPVVLPGNSIEDIPTFLNAYSTTRYETAEFTDDGVADLLLAITGRPRNPRPPRGRWRGGLVTVEPVRLAELPWQVSGTDVRAAGVWIDGVRYEHGIEFRPASVTTGFVEVDLGGAYQRLTSMFGVLDDAADSFQVARFEVCLDGDPYEELRAARGKPGAIDLDVTGVSRLRLEMRRLGRPPQVGWGDPTLS
jgi:hypothetical protein